MQKHLKFQKVKKKKNLKYKQTLLNTLNEIKIDNKYLFKFAG